MTFNVSPTSLSFNAEKSERTLTIKANGYWSTKSKSSWVNLSKTSGTGDATILVTANANTGTSSRDGSIVFTGPDGKDYTVSLKQESQYININPSSDLTFGSTPNTQNLEITTNGSWTATSSVSWLTVSPSSGNGNATIKLSVSDNPSANSRSGKLTIKNTATSAVKTINVSQHGRTLYVSAYSVTFNKAEGETQMVRVTTDAPSTDITAVSSNTGWLTVTRNGNILSIKATENSTISERKGTINVSLSGVSGLTKTISVTQAGTTSGGQSGGSNQVITVNSVSLTMVYVKGGTFTMGATSEQSSDYESDERPTHQVTLSDYYIGQTEVTQALWQAVMGSNPSYFMGNNNPVEKVSWDDCQTFISKLNTLTGKRFRLPTEAEWEFAARGGNNSKGYKYSGSNTIGDVAWYYDNSSNKTHEVGTKSPNELGIYDMSGNVWEWCQDWYDSYSSSAQTNPTGPSSGSNRVFRGGGWLSNAGGCRVSLRSDRTPGYRDYYLGLRLVLLPSDQPYQPGAGTNNNNGHEYVDLGLSVKWATCNVGASKPEDYGSYFAWGETTTKTTYDWSTYKWCNGSYTAMTKYCTSSSYDTVDNKTTLELADDAAYKNWGGSWRMPTEAELYELRTKCTWTWTTQNGVSGCKFVGPNGNSIFLPAAGYRYFSSLLDAGSYGNFWSSSLSESSSSYAYYLYFDSGYVDWYYNIRYYGFSVRGVCP